MSLPEIPQLLPVVQETDVDPNFSIAIIKDGSVYQVMNTDGQTAALLLSGPTFVQVDKTVVSVGDTYNAETQTFSN